MNRDRTSSAVALSAAVGLAVLTAGALLGVRELDWAGVVVLALAAAGAMLSVVLLPLDPLIGTALAVGAFLPYARVFGFEFRASTLIPPVLVLMGALVTLREVGAPGRLRRSGVVRWTLAYVLTVAVSSAVNQGRLSTEAVTFLTLWIFTQLYFLGYVLHRPEEGRAATLRLFPQLSRVVVLIAGVSLAVGMIEYVHPRSVEAFFAPLSRVQFWGARGALGEWLIPLRRTGSVVGSPNAFGAMLAVGTLLALGLHGSRRAGRGAIAAALVAGIVLLATSRGATMGVLSGIAVFALTSRHRWWAVPLLIGVVVAATSMPSSVEFISSGYVPAGAEVARGVPAAAERLFVWQRSLEGSEGLQSFLIGSGPINRAFLARTGLRGAHNLLITNFVFFGVAGVICVLGLCAELLRVIRRLWGDAETRSVARTMLCVLTALLVHSLVDDILFYNTAVMLIVFPFLALLLRLDRAGESRPSEALRPVSWWVTLRGA